MTALDGLTPLQLSACLPYFLQTTFLTKRRAFTGRSGTLDVSLPEHPEGQRVLAVAGLLRRYMSLLNQSLLSTTISCRARAPECLPTCCRPSTRMSPSTPRVTPLARPSSLPIAMLGARTSGGTRSGRPPGNRSSSAGRVRPPGAVLDQPSFARMILSDVLTAQSHPCVSSCPYKNTLFLQQRTPPSFRVPERAGDLPLALDSPYLRRPRDGGGARARACGRHVEGPASVSHHLSAAQLARCDHAGDRLQDHDQEAWKQVSRCHQCRSHPRRR